jgi:hypothetical protein
MTRSLASPRRRGARIGSGEGCARSDERQRRATGGMGMEDQARASPDAAHRRKTGARPGRRAGDKNRKDDQRRRENRRAGRTTPGVHMIGRRNAMKQRRQAHKDARVDDASCPGGGADDGRGAGDANGWRAPLFGKLRRRQMAKADKHSLEKNCSDGRFRSRLSPQPFSRLSHHA